VNVVLDTSVILKLVFSEEYTDEASALITQLVQAQWNIVAPGALHGGVTNAIRWRTRREGQPLSLAPARLDRVLQIPIGTYSLPTLYRSALVLAERYSLSTYDALYLALAEALNCDLWTGDERVLRALAGREPRVHWIGDFVALEQ
jgi:predicted nucleic acid-binding protein